MTNKVNLAELFPLIRETLSAGGSFTLTITGSSMYPFILGGRDRVTLSPITQELKKNDLPLYRRADGAFVLHRIVKVEKDGTYTCCGDHQWRAEKGLRREQMIAIATAYVRKGKALSNRNVPYRIYRTVWTWVMRWRWVLFTMQRWPARVKQKLKKRK
ncbi:MAG: S24/S26 family peptidase [Oscillospiraceae bacterium]|nr:S24/S26 family peptidase [Oscillospiraceae bacterium]